VEGLTVVDIRLFATESSVQDDQSFGVRYRPFGNVLPEAEEIQDDLE
jgi:hypothetical protein